MPLHPKYLQREDQDHDQRCNPEVGLENTAGDERTQLGGGQVRNTLRLVCHEAPPGESSNAAKVRAKSLAARTRATARLRSLICERGLTQDEAGRLVGVDGRQIRRWLSGDVPLGALELFLELEAMEGRKAA